MKKIKKVLLIILLILPFLSVAALSYGEASNTADTDTYYNEQLEASGAEELIEMIPEDTFELLEEMGLESLDYNDYVNFDPKRLFGLLGRIISGSLKNPVKSGAAAIGIIIICAVFEGFKGSSDGKTLDGVYALAATLCIGTVIILPVLGCISDVCAAIKLSAGFMLAFIPVIAALIAASGNPLSSYAYNSIIFAAAEIISRFSSTILMPFVSIYMGINIASGVSPHINLQSTSETVKKSVTNVLSFCGTLFVGLLSVQSIVTNAADSMTLKTAKFVTSNFIPVVGSALGDTLATVQGCVSLVKGTVGAFGMIALALIYIPVIIEVVCWMLTVNICIMCGDIMNMGHVTKLLKGINSALGILIAILIFCGVMLIVSTAIIVKIKTG